MNIEPLGEGLAKLRDVRDVGEQAQLDLAVVSRNNLLPRCGHEGGADFPPVLGADRDVLQVRVEDDRRPVVVAASAKEVCTRSVRGSMWVCSVSV